jgi:hypothetical protein
VSCIGATGLSDSIAVVNSRRNGILSLRVLCVDPVTD